LGNAEFSVCAINGKVMAKKRTALLSTKGSFTWKELSKLPSGIYFLQMKINNSGLEKSAFFNM
jgi:hypothetical protein